LSFFKRFFKWLFKSAKSNVEKLNIEPAKSKAERLNYRKLKVPDDKLEEAYHLYNAWQRELNKRDNAWAEAKLKFWRFIATIFPETHTGDAEWHVFFPRIEWHVFFPRIDALYIREGHTHNWPYSRK